jgi:protein-tyrosine phosphatase
MSGPSAPFRVLFVCTANQCRSAMAAAMAADEALRHEGAALEFASAGSHALAGSPATAGTIEVSAAAGLDLAGHRARELDRRVLADADLVLTMTREHIAQVLAYERAASRRTFTLAAFARAVAGRTAPSPDELVDVANEFTADQAGDDVPDPVGQGQEAHLRCVDRLDELVRPVVGALAATRAGAGRPRPRA